MIRTIFIQVRGGHVGQKVVAEHEAHDDEVINQALDIGHLSRSSNAVGRGRRVTGLPLDIAQPKLKGDVLPQQTNMDQLQLVCLLK